jgi:hypothetical protein
MKLRHAAALALVGWYLMMPPVVPDPKHPGNFAAIKGTPLSYWEKIGSFDTAKDCEDARQKNVDAAMVPLPTTRASKEWWAKVDLSDCFASDDPRLAK